MVKIPIGISDFKNLHDENCYFVDKSLLIKDILDDGAAVILFTRPRRFGKTLNLSMISYYFDRNNTGAQSYFEGLAIWQQGDLYQQQRGKYPVIFITLKDVKSDAFADALIKINGVVRKAYQQYAEELLASGLLDAYEQKVYQRILNMEASQFELSESLLNLTAYLERFYQEKVFLLIDEYDSPLHASYSNKYYQSMASFMRDFLSSVLKDNVHLQKGILTGILRVAKESIFSGLNHLEVYSILKEPYAQYFGFTQPELDKLLQNFQLTHIREDIQQWYNGYSFGSYKIYNPWSILECVKHSGDLKAYWVNTSDNALISALISSAPDYTKIQLEKLLQGELITETIDDSFVFADLDQQQDTLWTLLLNAGYLTVNQCEFVLGQMRCQLRFPNREIHDLFYQLVARWFPPRIAPNYPPMLAALINDDIDTFKHYLGKFLSETFSYFDTQGKTKEQIYHVFVLGLIAGLTDYFYIRSNREAGEGRYDVVIIPKDPTKTGIIFEFKALEKSADDSDLKIAAEAALKQIQSNGYLAEFKQAQIKTVLLLGIAFSGKKVECVSNQIDFGF